MPPKKMHAKQSTRVDFNVPGQIGPELEYIAQAFERKHISGDGHFTKKSQEILEKLLGAPKVLLTTSCTHALEMSAILLNLQPGDEVIIPSFTFVTTINAFVLHGATPVFCDIRPDTLNLDENKLPNLINNKTKAIIPVHYAGVSCEMDAITVEANKRNISIIEDNAHGLFGKYQGKSLGTFGDFSTLSFHETKNITCGEGGAIIINNDEFIDRAEIIREKGTNRSRFFRGMVDKYTWIDIGSSYLPSDILAAVLLAQLENWEIIQARRRVIWDYYYSNLTDWAEKHEVRLPTIPPDCEQAYHMFYILLPSLPIRQKFIHYLRDNGIVSVFHYLPLHLSKMGRQFGGNVGDCPVTEDVSDRLLRLPFYNSMCEEDMEYVVTVIRKFTEI